MAMSSVAQEST
jgi:hypothetical protein